MSEKAPQEAAPPAKNEAEQTLSPAELKKRAKAEKQARRAAQKDQQQPGDTNVANGDSQIHPPKHGGTEAGPADGVKSEKKQHQKGQTQAQQKTEGSRPSHHQRTPSQQAQSGAQQSMPVRQRQLHGEARPVKKENKNVELFSHLYQPRRSAMSGVSKDVHPAVLQLGFQLSAYEITGSSARCVAMLRAFKEAIQSYTTPTGVSLPRHMNSHFLSPQIEYLKSCRPIAESMGNAIRWLKKLVADIDPSMPEQEAKDSLCSEIDRFVRERIYATDTAVATSASRQIRPNSVVVAYAKSSLVERTILHAHAKGTQFRVIVIDTRPLFEGKNLANTLVRAGVEVEYLPYSAISYAMKHATLVLLGAHSMLSNGRLQSRVGTAAIAMQAKIKDIPVIVCCESIKFSGKVALDSIVLNEVAPAEELRLLKSTNHGPAADDADVEGEVGKKGKADKSLEDWMDLPNLQILNLMYDVTPAEYITMVICEYGSLPPSSVPVVHRLANEGD
nr:putative translation initiation factor eif-2b subunit delta [Quercus suber]